MPQVQQRLCIHTLAVCRTQVTYVTSATQQAWVALIWYFPDSLTRECKTATQVTQGGDHVTQPLIDCK